MNYSHCLRVFCALVRDPSKHRQPFMYFLEVCLYSLSFLCIMERAKTLRRCPQDLCFMNVYICKPQEELLLVLWYGPSLEGLNLPQFC